MRRLPIIGLILTLVGLLSSTVVAAGPQPDRHKRPAGRRPTIDLLRADRAQLTLQLRAMNVAVRHQWIRLAKADHDEARARHAAARIRAKVASKEAELRTLRRRVKEMVIRSYVNGTDVSDVALLTSAEGTDAQRAHALLEVSSAQEANLVRQLRRAQADLVAARRQADGALTAAPPTATGAAPGGRPAHHRHRRPAATGPGGRSAAPGRRCRGRRLGVAARRTVPAPSLRPGPSPLPHPLRRRAPQSVGWREAVRSRWPR